VSRKLLVVDDDPSLRRLMRLELSDTYKVIDSGEPEQGLALALEHRPDAILLDLRMPKYSGYELLQTYATFSRTQSMPVFVVSGETGLQTKEYCMQLGAAGYFEKPLDFDELRKVLGRIAKTQRFVPRSEVRVRLRVPLKLRGTDISGKKFEETGATENVGLSGFLCACKARLAKDSIVEVFLTNNGDEYVGKAKIVHCDARTAPILLYGCRFVEKTGP
jgi:DNA-binding response OmpR family regulator